MRILAARSPAARKSSSSGPAPYNARSVPMRSRSRPKRTANPGRFASAPPLFSSVGVRKSNGIDLLVELLKSDDREFRNVALLTVREIPSDKLAEALNAELELAKPELQAQLIEAMADCHNPRSIQAVRAKAASESPLIDRKSVVSGKREDR